MLKRWSVCREGRPQDVGEVSECGEALANCAALSKYGVSDDEIAAGEDRSPNETIHSGDASEVSPAR